MLGHASQCEVANPHHGARINKPILWSVTATDEGLSLSRHVLATDNLSFCQVCAISPAKASNTLKLFASSLYKMVYQKRIHCGSDVARKNKIHADPISLRQSEKSILGEEKKEKYVALYVSEWNVRTLMDRKASQCPERNSWQWS